ncbi:unnamed protein product [Victoria cruziana]
MFRSTPGSPDCSRGWPSTGTSYFVTPKGSLDLSIESGAQAVASFTTMDREARVLRYRKKRKNRNLKRQSGMLSRKAYAETRPRIKGRFAKRTDVEVEVDQIYSSALIVETGRFQHSDSPQNKPFY